MSGYVSNCDVRGTIDVIYADDINSLIEEVVDGKIFNSFADCSFRCNGAKCYGRFFGINYYTAVSAVNCCWNSENVHQTLNDNFENCYAIPANNTVDYAEKLNDVMIEGAAKWVMGVDGYPTLDFSSCVQNWFDVAERVIPIDGVYHIDSPEQLAYIAKIVNEGNTLEGQTVLLRNDLDLSEKIWTPIGRYNAPFSGELNGNGHSVTGLTISYNSLGYLEGYAGLVGYAGHTAYLHHLNVDGNILSDKFNCGLLLGGSRSGSH